MHNMIKHRLYTHRKLLVRHLSVISIYAALPMPRYTEEPPRLTCLCNQTETHMERQAERTHTQTIILYTNTHLCQQEWCKDSLLVSQGHHLMPFLTLLFYLLSLPLCLSMSPRPIYLSLTVNISSPSLPGCQATHPNMRTYYFCTDTAKEMESWMKVMTDAALVHTEPARRWVLTTGTRPHRYDGC